MPEKSSVSRRSFLEKVAIGAGIVAAGGIVSDSVSPLAVLAEAQDPATAQMNAGAFGWNLNDDPTGDDAPSIITNPNILMIMVDQLRVPQYWLTPTQQGTLDLIAPNIAFLRKHSYTFSNFYVAAQSCTPSRAAMVTGLYAPQTGMFETQVNGSSPNLNTHFPTFGNALQDIAGYNASNILWFGKWHLSNVNNPSGTVPVDSMPGFGFNGGANVGLVTWPSVNGSPNGTGNSGNNGYLGSPQTVTTLACDAAVAGSFASFWGSSAKPSAPWFACVSFVNPHDISFYPGFYPAVEMALAGSQGIPQNPNNLSDGSDFLPSSNTFATTLFSSQPSGWNYESTIALRAKSIDVTGTVTDPGNFLQPYFQTDITDASCNLSAGHMGTAPVLGSSDYIAFLNWYYYMIQLVDTQIGVVLAAALPGYSSSGSQNPSANTAIIFLSDHGEYAGSHGLHAKGGAVYDEVLRVPLYVSLPSQKYNTPLNQMCFMADIFMLVVELALGATYNWATNNAYKDQAANQNQSILSFILNGSLNETRAFTVSPGVAYAYVLTTTDETYTDYRYYGGTGGAPTTNIDCSLRNHVMCIRTKSDEDHSTPTTAYTGAKLALYSKWVLNPQMNYSYPVIDASLGGTDLIVQDYEYYDYLNYQNRIEVGNDYATALAGADGHGISGSGPGAQALLTEMLNALGNMATRSSLTGPITPVTGLAASVLTRPLTGVYRGVTLSSATQAGILAWYQHVYQSLYNGTCSS